MCHRWPIQDYEIHLNNDGLKKWVDRVGMMRGWAEMLYEEEVWKGTSTGLIDRE